MVLNNVKGFDGPYEAPLKLPTRKVLKSWIDYNGHMNVAYYTMAIDNSIDFFLEQILGIGETHAKTNNQGPIVVSQSKEERESKSAKTYLGNIKVVWGNGVMPDPAPRDDQQSPQAKASEAMVESNDLPF